MEKTLYETYSPDPREVHFSGEWLIGSSDAVTSQTPLAGVSGVTVTEVASEAGRYTLTFHRPYKRCKHASFTIVGPDDSAVTGTTTGEFGTPIARNKSGTSVDCQLRQTSGADASATSGTIVTYHVIVSDL